MNKGTLRRWNDERGFGFIVPEHGGADVFVHITQFPRDGKRPAEGELLYYTVILGKKNKPRASYIERLSNLPKYAKQPKPSKSHTKPQLSEAKKDGIFFIILIAISLLVGGAIYSYRQYTASRDHAELRKLQSMETVQSYVDNTAPIKMSNNAAACDGRTYCSQMTSCTEAKWFLQNCPDTEMDGDGDGIPCEQQWCRH